jgi:hypothetical protein
MTPQDIEQCRRKSTAGSNQNMTVFPRKMHALRKACRRMKKTNPHAMNYRAKDRHKVLRTVFEFLFWGRWHTWSSPASFISPLINRFPPRIYQPQGFIALSILGLDRTQSSVLIDSEMLSEHLAALQNSDTALLPSRIS